MAVFAYRGRDSSGQSVSGTLEADTERAAVAALRGRGLMITSVQEREQVVTISQQVTSISARIKREDFTLFTRQLATMVSAGLPLVTSLQVLTDQTTSRRLRDAIKTLQQGITAGGTMSAEMSKQPRVFSELYVNSVRAGEVSGALDTALNHMADYLEREMELVSKVKTAATYPAVVSVVAVIVAFMAIRVIVPSFVNMLAGFGTELPLPTRLLLGISGFINVYFLHMLAGLAAAVGLVVWSGRTAAGRVVRDRIILRLPIVGPLMLRVSLAQLSRTLAVVVKSGIPLLQGLQVVSASVGNRVIGMAITSAAASVREGEPLSEPLSRSQVIPPLVTAMIRVGEETGEMEEVLTKLAEFYELQVDSMVKRLSSLVEPVMIAVVGGVVGFIAMSIMFPLFALISAVR